MGNEDKIKARVAVGACRASLLYSAWSVVLWAMAAEDAWRDSEGTLSLELAEKEKVRVLNLPLKNKSQTNFSV